MIAHAGSELFLCIFSMFCFLGLSIGLFQPVDNFLIDSGSSSNTTVGDRVFLSDTSEDSIGLSIPHEIFVSTNSNSIESSIYGPQLFRTARVFNATSRYSFPIKNHGRHWIRLYFFPFVDGSYNLTTAVFSVSVHNVTLFRDFQPQSSPIVKEYSFNITSDNLVLVFTPSSKSFAFVNALEISSVPDELIPGHVVSINDPPSTSRNLQNQALETVARVNMGNLTVLPQNDSLWRTWVSDDAFLRHSNLGQFVSNLSAVTYVDGLATEDAAPRSVYGTFTGLLSESDPSLSANVTWYFDVDPGFDYLVRFHFCEIVNPSGQPLFFNAYINSDVVFDNIDVAHETSKVFGAPFYKDAIVRISDDRVVNVSVGTNTENNQYPNAILNGLEIMKINSSRGSLDVLDADVSSALKQSSVLKLGVVLGLVAGILFIALAFVIVFFLVCRKRRKLAHNATQQRCAKDEEDANFPGNGFPNGTETTIFSNSKFGYQFPFVAVQEATENFSESLVIGVGGFGKVYKGVMRDGTVVAVKRGAPQSRQGLAEFRTEIEMLSQFRHRHLVSLIGYCDQQEEMIIIYEYMESGTLKDHLYDSDVPALSWRKRLQICIGAARGLHYLHTGSSKPIIHRDVKSANILLDENLMAKVADFGLSKTGPDLDQTHVSTAVKGSFGYLDPEYLIRQQLTEKSDVYSFGVVLVEVLCGRPVINPSLTKEMVNLVEWAVEWQKKGELHKIIDPRMVDEIEPESLRKFGDTAEKCLAASGADRPSMGDVLWNLECALQLDGEDAKSNQTGNSSPLSNGANSFVNSVSATQFSIGSASDIAGTSMSKIFSEMVKAEMR